MPSPHDYQHPLYNAEASNDSSGSDDDLDLEELDHSTVSPQPNREFRESRDYTGRKRSYGPGIALRNMRVGAGSRWKRNASGRGDFEEDTDSLLDNRYEQGVRSSHGSASNVEDGPLLSDRRASTQDFGYEPPRKFGFLRLPFKTPSFLRGKSVRLHDKESVLQPPREVLVGQHQSTKYPANVVSNAKYTPWSFLPRTLYNEFSFFFNIYFLLVALSQVIPVLRIGYLSSYIAPLAFVVSISLGKEALDDIGRRRRDAEANAEEYCTVTMGRNDAIEVIKKSRDLKVGDKDSVQ